MGKLLLIMLIVVTSGASIVLPWLGVIAYYFLALFDPRAIWPWIFEMIRVSFWVATSMYIGFLLKLFKNNLDYSFIKTKINFYVITLWSFLLLSYFLGAYQSKNNLSQFDPNELIIKASKIYLCYFIAILLIDDLKKLKYIYLIYFVTTFYYILWANTQYFNSNWEQFNFGRLMGPRTQGSLYGDENGFAMLFVTGLPFVIYGAIMIKNKMLRLMLFCLVPLGIHAIFLTGSRGGLIGIFVVFVILAIQSGKKSIAIALLSIILIFYIWQGGAVMKDRSSSITSYDQEESAESRLIAWRAGYNMAIDSPIAGVGIGCFTTAFPFYTNYERPIIAHNTFVQYTAESGIGAGLCYIMICYYFIKNSLNVTNWCKNQTRNDDVVFIQYMNNACFCSFCGLLVCSLFLVLCFFEIYFYLLIIINSLNVICNNSNTNNQQHQLI